MAVLAAKKNQSVKLVFPNKSERDLRLFHMSASREKHASKHADLRSAAISAFAAPLWDLAAQPRLTHIRSMETNFFIFRERLAIACRLRGITYDQLCSSIGLGGRCTVDLEHAGLRALDIYRLAQIADRLDVSIDWLLGRSKAMELREKQCQGEIG